MPTFNIDSANISVLSSNSTTFSGSLFGTSSWAQNVTSASYSYTASSAISASIALTASFLSGSVTSASYAYTASSSVSSSWAVSSSRAISASWAPNIVEEPIPAGAKLYLFYNY